MLDPRIYRTGLVAVALALIVFAFSLEGQPTGLGTTLVPDAFNSQNVQNTLTWLARNFPDRKPGSPGDDGMADYVAGQLGHLGYSVSRSSFRAATPAGTRTLQNVTATLAGSSANTILIVSHRDSQLSPGRADLTGTAVMLELARVLGGETANRTVVLASVSGSSAAAGAAQLARNLPGPVNAVVVLGDLGNPVPRQPVIVPWSRGRTLAPPLLRNTLGAALTAQASLKPAQPSVGGQLLHLAFPMSLTEQAPFNAVGAPAVLLNLDGERAPSSGEATSANMMGAVGRALLQSINALNGGADVPAPSAYLVIGGKLIPDWAVRLLALTLILPVVITTIDGLARARRRGHPVLAFVGGVIYCALAFAFGWLVVLGAHAVGLLSGAPAGPVPASVASPDSGGAVTLALAVIVIALGLFVLAPRLARLGGLRLRGSVAEGTGSAAGIAVSLVLSFVALVMWAHNPYAGVLLVPALHLWMWVGATEVPVPRPVRLGLVALGALAPALAVLYYALGLGLSPLGVAWNGVLMIAGGQIDASMALLWSVALGCLVSMLVLAVRGSGRRREAAKPITVRGPTSYAGPGSLGGTESALRR